MKTTVSIYDFRQAFHDMGRGDQFSYDGLTVLFQALEDLAEDTGHEAELDVIALCCEFAEGTPEEIAGDYGVDLSECEDEDEEFEAVMEFLQGNTFVCGYTKETIVYQQF